MRNKITKKEVKKYAKPVKELMSSLPINLLQKLELHATAI